MYCPTLRDLGVVDLPKFIEVYSLNINKRAISSYHSITPRKFPFKFWDTKKRKR